MSGPADILQRHYAQQCSGPIFMEVASGGGINSQNQLIRFGSSAVVPTAVLKRQSLPDGSAMEDWRARLDLHRQAAVREPLVPRIILTDDGQAGVVVGDDAWSLLEYRAGGPFTGQTAALVSAARGLARLHQSLRDLPGQRPVSALYDPLSPAEQAEVRQRLQTSFPDRAFAGQVLMLLDVLLPGIAPQLQGLENDPNLPSGWVHRDFHPANALFSADELVAILDLDSLVTDLRMQAVAFAASRFAPGLDEERLWQFLAAYHAVDPLTMVEVGCFPAFVRREALRRICWIIRVNVLESRDLWRGDLSKQLGILQSVARIEAYFAGSDADRRAKLER